VNPANNDRILAETSKFEKVALSMTMPDGVCEQVDYSMYQRGRHWVLCEPSLLSGPDAQEQASIQDIWSASPELFPNLLWGMIRWHIRARDFQRLVFLVSSKKRKQVLARACQVLRDRLPRHRDVFDQAQIMVNSHFSLGFSFLRDPRRPPFEGERMLLLRSSSDDAILFEWSQGSFEAQQLSNDQVVDLDTVHRIAICSDVLDAAPPAVEWFHSERSVRNYAVANYVVWHPVIKGWELERYHRKAEELRQQIDQLEQENEQLESVIRRARHILHQLSTMSQLEIGGHVWPHSESISAQLRH
jgi:hypothetical protein